jgi:hypothetical protein
VDDEFYCSLNLRLNVLFSEHLSSASSLPGTVLGAGNAGTNAIPRPLEHAVYVSGSMSTK